MPGVLTVSPLADPSNYDKIVCAGITNAGICIVTDADRKYDWDTKKSAGSQGTTITYRGWDLAKPKVKFLLWTDAMIRQFYDEFVPALSYDADKQAPKPFDVYHPKLFASQIYWMVTTNIGELTDEGNQLWTVTCEFLEYRQATAKNATTTPATATTGPNSTKPTVLDEQDKEILRLTEEFRRPN
jgi:hypothetical protein